ncbi:TonB-dependent receptor [Novosphingobium lentum]|uniref:TonB-dependent receptor n=1 Tax=Novosphingobium lentum TaxID=145287 RepID=UPI00082AB7E0|nr:TonB-dependent receptor [Novosphingobium lentum]
MSRTSYLYLASTAAMALAQPALVESAMAQGAPAAADEAAPQTGLQEIVVTAQKRGENLQDVPIAVTAVTAELAEKAGITGPEQLTQLMPGVTFTRQAQGGVPFIRGVGTTSSFVGNEPSVALFVDDVYLVSGNAAVFDFNNIAAVEVLKGPQGTLFGRNATGGVIHVKTKDPTFDPHADMTLGYSNYDTITGQFYGSTGLTKTVAVNFAGFYNNQQDGWGHNFAPTQQTSLTSQPYAVTPGQGKANYSSSYGFRGKLLWEPSDDTRVLLSGMYAHRRSDQGYANRVVPGTKGRGGYDPETGAPGTGPGFGGNPIGFYDNVDSIGNGYGVDFSSFSGKLTHDFGAVKVTSITAYSKLRVDPDLALDASPQNALNSYNHYGANTFTQELQVASPDGNTFKWILGGFYMHDRSFFLGNFSGNLINQASFGYSAAGVALAGPGTPLFLTPKYQTSNARMLTNSYSAFAQGTYPVLPDTNITLGVRYTSDHRKAYGGEGGFYNPVTGALLNATVPVLGTVPAYGGPFSDQATFNAVTGRAAIDHHFGKDLMIYAAYNRGFKSGVYNLAGYGPNTLASLPPVKPEKIDAYTAGFKSEFFDHMVRLNVEGYYYKYKNIQVQNNRPDVGGTIFVNGGAATIKGLDAELTVAPAAGLTLTAAVNVQKGRYDEFKNGPTFFLTGPNAPPAAQQTVPASCNFAAYPVSATGSPETQILAPLDKNGNPVAGVRQCDLSGNKTVLTPPFTLSLTGDYAIPTSAGEFGITASWLHTGNYFFEPDNLYLTRQPIYDIVNASVRWTSVGKGVTAKVFVANLLQKKYFAYIANSTTSGTKGAPAAPRTYGVQVGFHF